MNAQSLDDKVIRYVEGTAIPKPADNQNTDMIAPARFLKEITFKNMGLYAFFDERYHLEDGVIWPVAEHPFNNPNYKGGNILIAGKDFGSGSSREHAPQALKRHGIRAIIAESYAGIFDGNCASIGIVAVSAPGYAKNLAKEVIGNPKLGIGIDLGDQAITITSEGNNRAIDLEINEEQRQAFLNGNWDEMALLAKNKDKVAERLAQLPNQQYRR